MENNKWYNKELKEVEKLLETNVKKRLTGEEEKQRQEKYGLNAIKKKKKKSLAQKFLEQFKDFIKKEIKSRKLERVSY